MNIIFSVIFIVVALVIFVGFRDRILGEGGLNPINIIISIVFLIVLWYFFRWVYNRYKSLNTLTSITDAKEEIVIKNSKLKDKNSNNFTISSWFYVNDWNYKYGSKKILLKRGENNGNPEIYFSENENNIVVKLLCYNNNDGNTNNIVNNIDNDIDNDMDIDVNIDTDLLDDLPDMTADYNSEYCRNYCGLDSSTGSYKPCTTECYKNNCWMNDKCLDKRNKIDNIITPSVVKNDNKHSNTIEHTCEVRNFPLQKWVNLIISVYGRTLDIYIDGKLVRTCVLPGVVKLNSGSDMYITPDNGFHGFTSNIIYRPYESNPQEAYNIYYKGYGSAWINSIFNRYKVKVSLLKDSIETNSFQI